MRMFFFFFFFLLCLTTTIESSISNPITKQGEALNKLHYDATHLRRKAFVGPATESHDFFVSDPESSKRSKSKANMISDGSKENDKIVNLPGQPEGVDFNQYSGYVTVDGTTGRALFYYFAEAAGVDIPSSNPLILWLNGGPGCSSFGFGAMQEIGPFRVMSDGKTLYQNPYAWNKVANVLFLESPAGVGFSYSNTTDDYDKSGDQRSAMDTYAFLLQWMERFPEYKGKDFYIAGESYAGHFVPQLADVILQNQASNSAVISLKGIMMGNAVINEETDARGIYDYFWTHGLISDLSIAAINLHCNFTPGAYDQSDICRRGLQEVNQVFNSINVLNIYAPLCFSSSVTPSPKTPSIEDFDPCTNLYVTAYMNNPEVQRALHANTTQLKLPWSVCSWVLTNWMDSPFSMLPIIRNILANKIRVWMYSGDIDARVPVTSTKYSLNLLNLPISTPWRSWSVNNEVGGYGMIYEGNLTFVTVRGAGHDVASYQPLRAFAMIKCFLQGCPLPS